MGPEASRVEGLYCRSRVSVFEVLGLGVRCVCVCVRVSVCLCAEFRMLSSFSIMTDRVLRVFFTEVPL